MNLDNLFGQVSRLLGIDLTQDSINDVRDLLNLVAAFGNQDMPNDIVVHQDVPYRSIEGKNLNLDVFVPQGVGPHPVLVYFHGGAWIWGSPKTHRLLTARLAQQGFLTLSVDYRLAPEAPFPAGFNDCVHAVHFAGANADQWHGDTTQLVLAGDSAGANLAAAVAIELARTAAGPDINAVGLLYGVFDFAGFEEVGLTRLLREAYIGESISLNQDPRVSPMVKAQLLPPAHIAVGDDDPLVEDAQALHNKLNRHHVVNELKVYPDMPHAFAQMEFLDPARPAIEAMCGFLRKHCG